MLNEKKNSYLRVREALNDRNVPTLKEMVTRGFLKKEHVDMFINNSDGKETSDFILASLKKDKFKMEFSEIGRGIKPDTGIFKRLNDARDKLLESDLIFNGKLLIDDTITFEENVRKAIEEGDFHDTAFVANDVDSAIGSMSSFLNRLSSGAVIESIKTSLLSVSTTVSNISNITKRITDFKVNKVSKYVLVDSSIYFEDDHSPVTSMVDIFNNWNYDVRAPELVELDILATEVVDEILITYKNVLETYIDTNANDLNSKQLLAFTVSLKELREETLSVKERINLTVKHIVSNVEAMTKLI